MNSEQKQTIEADDQPDPDSRLPFLKIYRFHFLFQPRSKTWRQQGTGRYPTTKKDDMFSRQNQLNTQRSMYYLMQSRFDNSTGWRDTTVTVG